MRFLNVNLFDTCLRLSPIRWQRVLEDTRVMRSILQKMLLMILDKLSKSTCIATFLFCKDVHRLVRKSGLLFTCLYLKQCSTSLQLAYGGEFSRTTQQSVPVSLTGSGLPRIIPSFHRKVILRHDDEADSLVQLYLSFFTLSKLIKMAKKVSYAGTFKSIVEPTDLESVSEFCGEFRTVLTRLIARYIPKVSTIPLNQGISWKPTWKSLPTHRRVNEVFWEQLKALGEIRPVSCFPALLFELNAFSFLLERVHASEDHFSQGILWPSYTRFARDPSSTAITNWCLTEFERVAGPQLPTYHQLKEPPICGRLGQSIEGGGKRRIFAIGNYVNQRLLAPVHDWLMQVLRLLKTDGTFVQDAPLRRLSGAMDCFSYDLKSATDRWPLQVMFEVLSSLFDRSFASSVRSALALNLFEVPFVKKKKGVYRTVSFVSGQPLGYYSSWPLFSLSHHFVVWWCAEQVYPGKLFLNYGILGDDVVIADREVAAIYGRTLDRLRVGISWGKSLVSTTGAAEFAKRLWIRGLTKDVSPRSARAFLNFYNPFGLVALGLKYQCRRYSTLVRIGGGGYKTLGRIQRPRSKKIQRLWSIQMKALLGHGHLSLWLGRGRPLNPYLFAALKEMVLDQLKPKDIRVTPDELFVTEKVQLLQEYTQLRSWMKEWTTYVHWYFKIAMDPDTSLDVLFDAPICAASWKADRKDEGLLRFGLLWRLHDFVSKVGLDFRPPILSSGRLGEQSSQCILGGMRGTYLVLALGLVQPRAKFGVVLPGVLLNSAAGRDPRTTLIHYKTLGVSDRLVTLDFIRS